MGNNYAYHQQHKIDQEQPVSLHRNLALREERAGQVAVLLPHEISLTVAASLRKAKSEEDNQDWRASSEPVQRAPTMAGRANQTSRERSREEIPKRIPLLKHSRYDSTSSWRTVLKRSRRSITIQTSHGNTEKSATCQELAVRIAETGTKLQYNEEHVVHDEGPFASVPIGCDTENDGADGSEHQHEGDTPCDLRRRFTELLCEFGDGQGDGEEIEGIPRPCDKGDLNSARFSYEVHTASEIR